MEEERYAGASKVGALEMPGRKKRTGLLCLAMAIGLAHGAADATVETHRLDQPTAPRFSPPPEDPGAGRKFPYDAAQTNPLVDVTTASLAPWVKLPPHLRVALDANGLPVMSLRDEMELRTQPINQTMGVCACSVAANSAASFITPLGQVSLKDTNGERFAVSVVSFDYALRLFQDLDHRFLEPQRSIRDGCHMRAHQMARYLENRGIATGKAMATGLFQIVSDRMEKGRVVWQFHVAPMLVVDEGARRRVYVLDPALFSEPVPLESWLSLLMQASRAELKDVFLTNRYVFQPSESTHHITSWRSVDAVLAVNAHK